MIWNKACLGGGNVGVIKTKTIIPNRGLIAGEPELLEPGFVTEAKDVIIHPTLGIQTRPGLTATGTAVVSPLGDDRDFSQIFVTKPFLHNNKKYLFILGGEGSIENPTRLVVTIVDLSTQHVAFRKALTPSDDTYFNYFYDSTKGHVINNPESLVITGEGSRLWILNRELPVNSIIDQTPIKITIDNEVGDLGILTIYEGRRPYLIRGAYSSTNPSSLANEIANDISSVLSSQDYSITVNGNEILIDPNPGVVTELSASYEPAATDLWKASGLSPNYPSWYTFTIYHDKEIDNGVDDKFKINGVSMVSGSFEGEWFVPANGDSIYTVDGEMIGYTVSSNVKLANRYYKTIFNIRPDVYITSVGFDDRQVLWWTESGLTISSWEIAWNGNVIAQSSTSVYVSDGGTVTLNSSNYLTSAPNIKNTLTISYSGAGTGYHAAPKIKAAISVSGSQIKSVEKFADNNGKALKSLDDVFTDVYNTLKDVFNLSGMDVTYNSVDKIITITVPASYQVSLDIISPAKNLSVNKDPNGETLTIEEAYLPFFIDLAKGDLGRPVQFLNATGINYFNTLAQSAPSFVNHKIRDILFHQGRLFLLSEEGLSASAVNNYGKFFEDANGTYTETSYIDIQIGGTESLDYIIPIEKELYLFGKRHQYIIHFDRYISGFSFVLKPTTSYLISRIRPILAGSDIFFVTHERTPQTGEEQITLYNYFVQPNTFINTAENKSNYVEPFMPPYVNWLASSSNGDRIFLFYNEGGKTKASVFQRTINNNQVINEGWTEWILPTEFDSIFTDAEGHIVLLQIISNGSTHTIYTHTISTSNPYKGVFYDSFYDDNGNIIHQTIKSRVAIPVYTAEIPPHIRARLDLIYLIFDYDFNGYIYYKQDEDIESLGTFTATPYISKRIGKSARGAELIIESSDPISGDPNHDLQKGWASSMRLTGVGFEFRTFNRRYGKY